MRRNTKKYVILLIILAIIVLAGILYFKNDDIANIDFKSLNLSKDLSSSAIKALGPWEPTGTLVYSNENVIDYKNITGDADSYKPKIKNASYQVNDDGSILLLDENNKLSIWRYGKTTKVVTDDNRYNPLPVLSSDAKYMAVIGFSNAERNFGYILQVFNSDNQYQFDAYSSTTQIISPCWQGDKLIFAIQKDKGSELYSFDLGNKKSSMISDAKNIYISQIACRGNSIIFTAGDSSKNDSNQSIYKLEGKDVKTISAKKGTYHELHISPNEEDIAYIDENSELTAQNIARQDTKKITKVTHFAGWIK